MVPDCAEGGVLGVLPGIIGSLQANEVIKVIAGIGEPLSGRLFLFDALRFESRTLNISRDPANPLNGEAPTQTALIDYDEFCGVARHDEKSGDRINEITVLELQALISSGQPHQLIDVRETYEYEIANLGGELIPKATVKENLSSIHREGQVVVHCRTGKRSAEVIRMLQSEFGYTNLLNLKGGIMAWAEEVDQEMAKY
jgi:adenylyltransferase/sulfurtransferase